jgi:hypothetical protein
MVITANSVLQTQKDESGKMDNRELVQSDANRILVWP